MKNISIETLLTIVVLIWLAVLTFKTCDSNSSTTAPEQMSSSEIRSILNENFDSLEANQVRVIDSKIDLLTQILLDDSTALSSQQRGLLYRLKQIDEDMKQQGEELMNYISLRTETKQTVKEVVYYKDSTGTDQPLPDWFKRLPIVIESNYQDTNTIVYIKYDVLNDSIETEFLTYNDFELIQSVTADGDHIATVNNRNPFTYTLPGTSVFNLDIPEQKEPLPLSLGLQAGYYLTKDGHAGPGVGIGLSYNISRPIGKQVAKLFRRRNK